jgi:hypothetical protein
VTQRILLLRARVRCGAIAVVEMAASRRGRTVHLTARLRWAALRELVYHRDRLQCR